jgi:acyl carrier protein
MSQPEKEQMKELFPNACIIQHYGLTEASRSTFLKIHEVEGEKLESVGLGCYGVKLAIGEDQQIKIRGPHLATGIIAGGKVKSLLDDNGWLLTGDTGYIQDDFLYFSGRMDDVINCGGIKLAPENIEQAILDELGLVDGIAVVKVTDALRGEQPAIAYLSSLDLNLEDLSKAAEKALLASGLEKSPSLKLYSFEQFPKTETGKIQRNKLSSLCQNMQQQDQQTPEQVNTNSFAQSSDKQEAQLVTIWQDVLKISPISVNESFFDLGGDSLSAISVILNMEKAGIPKSISQKIFEGKSIAQILEQQPADNNQAIDARAVKLIAIWEEVLDVKPISVKDSFFDLGGDSLSAISVTMRMEKAGIPKETCRKIFEGLSINQIIEHGQPSQETKSETLAAKTEKTEAAPKRTNLALASFTLNVVRGLLVILNVSAHWMPGIIAKLPAVIAHYNQFLAPLYSSGTPGFAVVFGAGIGFFLLPRYQKSPSSVISLAKRNALLLAVGILAYALLKLLAVYASGHQITPMMMSNSLWNVLSYYFFAVLTIPIWLKILTRYANFSFACLFMAALFYSCHLIIDAANLPPSQNPFVQPWILLLTAKYNYLEMSSGVLVGAAVGNWIRDEVVNGKSLRPFAFSGLLLIFLAVVIAHEMGELSQWLVWPKGLSLWTWPLYLGFVLICIAVLYSHLKKENSTGWVNTGFNIVSIIGILAFPVFIGHEMVRPLARLLNALGVPFGLAISLTLFFCSFSYFIYRLYTMYFGKQPAKTVTI